MTRIEFQQWLDQFDEQTVIECVIHTSGTGYYDQGGNATVEEFKPDEQDRLYGSFSPWCINDHFEYSDLRGNQFVKEGHPYFGRQLLRIGAYNR